MPPDPVCSMESDTVSFHPEKIHGFKHINFIENQCESQCINVVTAASATNLKRDK